MKMNNLILFFLLVFSLSFISAESQETIGTFTQNQVVTINQVCADATYITYSVKYPNSTFAVQNQNMTSLGSGLFSVNFTNTKTLGRYEIVGISNGCDKTFATYMTIKNTSITFLIILLALATLFFIATWFVNEEFFVYISGVLFLISGIYVMINGIDIVNDWYSRAIAYVTIGLGLLFTLGAYIYNSYEETKGDEEEY